MTVLSEVFANLLPKTIFNCSNNYFIGIEKIGSVSVQLKRMLLLLFQTFLFYSYNTDNDMSIAIVVFISDLTRSSEYDLVVCISRGRQIGVSLMFRFYVFLCSKPWHQKLSKLGSS